MEDSERNLEGTVAAVVIMLAAMPAMATILVPAFKPEEQVSLNLFIANYANAGIGFAAGCCYQAIRQRTPRRAAPMLLGIAATAVIVFLGVMIAFLIERALAVHTIDGVAIVGLVCGSAFWAEFSRKRATIGHPPPAPPSKEG